MSEKKDTAALEDLSLPAPKPDNPSVSVHPLNAKGTPPESPPKRI